MTCPECKEDMKFNGYRPKNVVSLLGDMSIKRGYYHCEHCGHGCFPWDEILRLSPKSLTPGAEEVVTLLGIQDAFGKVADRTLSKATGLHLSESTVQRTTEAAGQRLAERLLAGEVFGPRKVWKWHVDAEGKTCAYMSLDATGVMMQGPDGAKADGRMAYVGMIFNPQPRRTNAEDLAKPCDGVRYLAGHYTLEELGAQMRRQAFHVGVDKAERWIALTDGGNGLEHWLDVYFPLAIKILDFRHASEYLNDLAKKYRKGAEAAALMTTWCHTMKHEGGAAILKVLEGLDRTAMSEEAQEKYDTATNYIRNNLERMKYPEYLSKGWQIGSGAVESACKTVINQRLNMGGMRWGETGSDQVCHLRALYRSDPDQWDAFWAYPQYAMAV
jgi:hypothetical protein